MGDTADGKEKAPAQTGTGETAAVIAASSFTQEPQTVGEKIAEVVEKVEGAVHDAVQSVVEVVTGESTSAPSTEPAQPVVKAEEASSPKELAHAVEIQAVGETYTTGAKVEAAVESEVRAEEPIVLDTAIAPVSANCWGLCRGV